MHRLTKRLATYLAGRVGKVLVDRHEYELARDTARDLYNWALASDLRLRESSPTLKEVTGFCERIVREGAHCYGEVKLEGVIIDARR